MAWTTFQSVTANNGSLTVTVNSAEDISILNENDPLSVNLLTSVAIKKAYLGEGNAKIIELFNPFPHPTQVNKPAEVPIADQGFKEGTAALLAAIDLVKGEFPEVDLVAGSIEEIKLVAQNINTVIQAPAAAEAAIAAAEAAAESVIKTGAMTEAVFSEIRAQNQEEFAASGFVHFGLTHNDPNMMINEGMWSTAEGLWLYLGKSGIESGHLGKSKSPIPVLNIAGVSFTIEALNYPGISPSKIKFPQAPDGKTTYNKATGEIKRYNSAAEAFAAETGDIEVVINREDMWGFEAWPEKVTEQSPYIYPNGLIQSKAAKMDGYTTGKSDRPITYYAVFEGDLTSQGQSINFYAANDAQRMAHLSNPKNLLYYDKNGDLIQWRLRQRTFAGLGNGDFFNIATAGGNGDVLAKNHGNARLLAQGKSNNSVFYGAYVDDSNDSDNGNGYLGISHSRRTVNQDIGVWSAAGAAFSDIAGECYFLPCGTVNRLNKGAYHPSINPQGAGQWNKMNGDGANNWYSSIIGSPTQTSQAFNVTIDVNTVGVHPNTGFIERGQSGRPDGRFYDAIYANGHGGVCRDMRYSAYEVTQADYFIADQKVKNGDYRGREGVRFTKIFTFVTNNAETANNYGRVPMTREEAIRVFSLMGAGSSSEIFYFDVARMSVLLYNPRNGLLVHSAGATTAFGNSAFGTRLNPSTGNTLFMGVDPAEFEASLRGTAFRIAAGNSGDVTTSDFCSNGDTLYAIVTQELPFSVGESVNAMDIIAKPEDIVRVKGFEKGWFGQWIPKIPNGTQQEFMLTRKPISVGTANGKVLYTNDHGATINEVSNVDWNWDYARSSYKGGFNSPSVVFIPYLAKCRQTKVDGAKPVYGAEAGVGSVYTTMIHAQSPLSFSLIGFIMWSGGPNPPYEQSLEVSKYIMGRGYAFADRNYWGKLGLFGDEYAPRHTPLPLKDPAGLNPKTPAIKTLNVNLEENGQAFIQYYTRGLYWNGNGWGDDGKVVVINNAGMSTDLNGVKNGVMTSTISEPLGWIKNRK